MSLLDADTATNQEQGLLASLRRLSGSFVEILHTRTKILSSELEEVGWFVLQLIVYALLALLFCGIGLITLTLFIIQASPQVHQLYVLGGFAAFYLIFGTGFTFLLRHKLKNQPHLFSTTLSELEKDCNHLGKRTCIHE